MSDEQLIRRHLRLPPDRHDLQAKIDPYRILRGKGFSHSQAKLALRGEAPQIKRIATLNYEELHDEYTVGEGSLGVSIVPLIEIKQVQVVVRPDSLTEEIVHKAPALGYEYLVRDGGIPGLALRVRKNGHKSYVLHYRVRGKSKSRKLKVATAGAVTLQMARDLARDLLIIAREGEDPALHCSTHAQMKRIRARERYRHPSEDPYYEDFFTKTDNDSS